MGFGGELRPVVGAAYQFLRQAGVDAVFSQQAPPAWIDGFRGWNWFACTFERCLYCMIFFTIIAMTCVPIPCGS